MDGRFSTPVWPGESLTVDMWVEGNQAIFRTSASGKGESGRTVLDGGLFTFA